MAPASVGTRNPDHVPSDVHVRRRRRRRRRRWRGDRCRRSLRSLLESVCNDSADDDVEDDDTEGHDHGNVGNDERVNEKG